MEHVINLSQFLLSNEFNEESYLDLIGKKILEVFKSNINLYEIEKDSIKKIFSNFENKDFIDLEKREIEEWRNKKLPLIIDNEKNNLNNVFVYPYFEGINQLGFGVVQLSQSFEDKNLRSLEIFMESAKCIYLNHSRKRNQEINYSKHKNNEKKSGFLSRLFGGGK